MGTPLIHHPWAGSSQSSDLGPTFRSAKWAWALCLGLLVMGALIWFLQGWEGAPPAPDYLGKGIVVGVYPPPSNLHATRPVIIIHHEAIPGLMDEPMSMPFIAASPKLIRGLRTGDAIAFGLKSTPDALLVVSIERLTPSRQKGGGP